MRTAKRVISAKPRVINAALAFWPEAETVANASGDGDDIFHHAADLHADHIERGINPQTGGAENLLDRARHAF